MRIAACILLVSILLGCRPPVQNPTPPRLLPSASVPEPPEEAAQISLKATYTDHGVELELPWEEAEVWRGYRPISTASGQRSNVAYFKSAGSSLVDPAPHRVELFYLARNSEGQVAQCRLMAPDRPLPNLVSPRIQVDKLMYTLSLLDGDQVVKRYPIALGSNPQRRKFCQDNASTPEGIYRVYNLQPEATFYRAFDIDYPNPIDQLRHRIAVERGTVERSRSIGGEIQIHGMGIGANWTFGCMALRNEDMDELFSQPALGVDLEVFITGSQIRPEDRNWVREPRRQLVVKVQRALKQGGYYQGSLDGQFGLGTAEALGRYQADHGLPVSCQLDSGTRTHFSSR